MNDKQIAALVKRVTAKAAAPKGKRRTYDATLDVTRQPSTDDDIEREEFFKEMQRREF